MLPYYIIAMADDPPPSSAIWNESPRRANWHLTMVCYKAIKGLLGR